MTNEKFLESVSLDGEIWKDVVGYEGLYVVSNLGRIASLTRTVLCGNRYYRTHNAKILKPVHGKKTKHLTAFLCKNGIPKHELRHRQVAIAFIPNPEDLPIIDHIDGNPENNRVDNLRWTTPKGNTNNPITRKRMSESAKKRDFSIYHKPIVCIRQDDTIEFYNSIVEASNNGFSRESISSVCHKRRKTHKKCRFMFRADYENFKSVNQRTSE